MAQRTFADLSSYRRNVDNAQKGADLLSSLIQGAQQGVALQNLPQTLQDQQLTSQLQRALMQQKLYDAQHPQEAFARELQKAASISATNEMIRNPNSGIGVSPAPGETIAVPSTIPQTEISLDQAIAANPNMAIPKAAPQLPITPIPGTNLGIDQNIPVNAARQLAQDKSDQQLRQLTLESQLRSQLDANKPQVFPAGSTVGTVDQIRRGEGVKIPDKSVEPKPYTLSPGEKLFAPDGSIISENPSNSTTTRPITVSPGSVVIGADGKEIFRNPISSTGGPGGKPLPVKIAERISDAESAVDNLVVLKSYIDNSDVKSISGPVAGRTLGANPFSETAQNFEGVRATAKQVIGKYLEGGVLRAEDEKKYEKIIPGLKMLTGTQQNQSTVLFNSLRNKLERDIKSYEDSGYDVTRLKDTLEKLDTSFPQSNKSVPEGKITIVAPDGVSGLWDSNKPIPDGFKLSQ